MHTDGTVTIFVALMGGLASFFSPCVLPLVPAYLSYISGMSIEELTEGRTPEATRKTGLMSLFFVFGFSIVFIAMGAAASSIGQALFDNQGILMKIGGVLVILFGLHMIGILKIKALYRERRFHLRMQNAGVIGALLMGMAFAAGWTPCTGPVLSGIATLAMSTDTLGRGIMLFVFYSIGMGIPFIVVGFATAWALKALTKFKKHLHTVEVVSGVLLVLVGILVFTGNLETLSNTLSRFVPVRG
jgi:cytochrome c-type biogenesis protein